MDAEQFEEHRNRLRAVAYRILGSAAEAEDAVQEAWLRFSRAADVENVSGWLTTVVAHICYDMLRSRKSRAEESIEAHASVLPANRDPADEALLAESVGLALLVVLDALDPAERLALVMHDMFGIAFDEIAAIIGRSPAAARQLASRARRRVRGKPARRANVDRQRKAVDAFIAAMRNGDFDALLAVLDPDAVVRADAASRPPGVPGEIRGARNWAAQAIATARGARSARPALVDGNVGIVIAPGGHLVRVLTFAFSGDQITAMNVISEPDRLRDLHIAVID